MHMELKTTPGASFRGASFATRNLCHTGLRGLVVLETPHCTQWVQVFLASLLMTSLLAAPSSARALTPPRTAA